MKLVLEELSRLPKLAWQATVDLQGRTCRVRHGSWVEPLGGGFVEGVWDGEFAAGELDRAGYAFGSGGVARGDAMTFVPSSGTTDYLYWHSDEQARRIEVSNSLPLLLAVLGDELDIGCPDYHSINESVAAGIDRYQRRIPTREGAVFRLLHRNLVVDSAGVREVDKPPDPPFAGFADYLAFMESTYERLARNARARERVHPMAILSTQSKGYDTTATNAVAHKYGVDQVFTVQKGKVKGRYADEDRDLEPDDDGSAICGVLGLSCVPIDRRAVERDPGGERLVYAAMHESGDLNMHAIGAHIVRPSLLLTGCLGEVWYPKAYYKQRQHYLNPGLVNCDLGSHGLTEVRLQSGYIQLAFPYLGARSRTDIFRITHSQEMEPWRLHTEYDRPIPRRIAEQAGIAREMFGQRKMGSVLEYPAPLVPIGEDLRRSYLAYLAEEGLLPGWRRLLLPAVRRWNAVVHTTSPLRHRLVYYVQRALSKVRGKSFEFSPLWSHLNGRIFCYCCNLRTADYRLGLAARAAPASAESGGRDHAVEDLRQMSGQ